MNNSMPQDSAIYVAGHEGLVGSALMRRLNQLGYNNLVTRDLEELDLTDQAAVDRFFEQEHPLYVFLAAAKVGGILANDTYPAEFIQQNLAIQTNVIHSAWKTGVEDLLFLGSSCIYPRQCPQPIKEEYILTGPLEPTNKAYALAKIAGIEMCWSYNRQYGTHYRAVMPTNLYGPGDNFNLEGSHVIPALIRKFHEARMAGKRTVEIWGTGKPRREFLHVDELADACIFVMQVDQETYENHTAAASPLLNVGTGEDLTIRELAGIIQEIVGFKGDLVFDTSKPDGTRRKLLDVSRMTRMGWKYKIRIKKGLATTYQWFLEYQNMYRK